MLNKAKKRMQILVLIMIIVPIILLAVFGIFLRDRLSLGLAITFVLEVGLLIAYLEARKAYKKVLVSIEKYNGLNSYIEKGLALAKQKRREEFIKERNKHNIMDDLYFGKDEDRENDYMKKEENVGQILGKFLYDIDKNPFYEELKKESNDLEALFVKANVSDDVLENLSDPSYKITKVDACKLAIALHLDEKRANEILGMSNYKLDRERKFDLAIIYFLENKLDDFRYINLALLGADLDEI